jgi:Ergosterol biosynthesis ERG4/ERG24 family
MRNGKKMKYKINGESHYTAYRSPGAHICSFITAFSTYLLALGLAVGIIINFGPSSFTYIYEHWIGLVTAALIGSIVQAFIWYAWSFRSGHLLALGGNTGNHLYDVSRLVCSRHWT